MWNFPSSGQSPVQHLSCRRCQQDVTNWLLYTVLPVLFQVLEWDLSPVTAHLWLTTLYQASSSQNWRRLPDRKIEFTDMPQTPQSEFCEVSDSACHIPDLSRCGGEDVTSECQQLSVPVTPSHEQYESNENAPECWTPSSNVCAIHRRSDHSNGCSECFVHTAQFSQQEFIQIVRVCIPSVLVFLSRFLKYLK